MSEPRLWAHPIPIVKTVGLYVLMSPGFATIPAGHLHSFELHTYRGNAACDFCIYFSPALPYHRPGNYLFAVPNLSAAAETNEPAVHTYPVNLLIPETRIAFWYTSNATIYAMLCFNYLPDPTVRHRGDGHPTAPMQRIVNREE